MEVITIREQSQTETGFTAIVSFDGRQEYPVTISNPFSAAQEQQLQWYFEDWLVYPTLDTVKAETAAMSVKTYGETLFEQVFKANFDAYSEYRQERGNLSNVQLEIISNNPEFHALHWEAMRDPDLPRPLAVDAVMIRKSIKPVAVSADVQPSPVINLLVVTARPDEEKDVSYRTISRPLWEAIAQSKLRVKVELLRPGTYEALSRHLEAKGAGFYHIVHLDMHGALMNYQQVQNPTKANRYLYRGRYGRSDLQPFDGVKAFVCFEGETQGKVDLVAAGELADLLTGKGIPVCILNACQSAAQAQAEARIHGDGITDTSLASRLMTAGMQMVLGMGYSVTVTAAKLMMTHLYQHLFAQKPITEAIRLSRKELFNDKERKAYFNKTINLEDWLLPVVYSHQPVNFNLRDFTPQEQEEYLLNRSQRYRFTTPLYGFIGRDLEILKVEKSLLRHNILLLQGMGGTGKTTLLHYLQEWWQTTHFVEDAFYFGYDQKAWNLSQILFTIAKQVYGDFDLRMFQAMPQPAQMEQLIDTLRTNRYAVILDNFESVTGQKLAIKNTLSKPKRQEIKEFLERLVGGQTFVVIGSRSGEEWLQEPTFDNNIYYLQGLDTEARSDLADKILERNVPHNRIAEIREDADFQKLMKLLDGYPLAMEVTLANLQRQSPKEILAGLQAGDVNLDSGSGDKTKSIIKCVEYSHSNLSPEAQKLLLCLAPFSGFIFRDVVTNYIEELQKLEPFQNYAFDKFDEAIQEAINWGLLSGMNLTPTSIDERLLRIQPVFPYFLNSKLETVDEATRKALHEGFKNHYLGLADSYEKLMESKEAQERQLGIWFCQWEYENLYHALEICLQNQQSMSIYFCLDKYFQLINDKQSNLQLAEKVCLAVHNYPPSFLETELGYQVMFAVERLGSCYLRVLEYQKARECYQQALEITPKLVGLEEQQKQLSIANTYHQLGIVAEESREFAEARRNYQQALEIYLEYGARYQSANTYHELGLVAQELREFAEARRNYQQALEIKLEYNDRYESAVTYHNLGIVAEQLREFVEARRNYQQALEIYLEYNDRYNSARTYHELGIVAQKLREFAEARRNYQQALEIKLEYSARYESAVTYHNLGIVAQELGEFAEARRNYQLALEIQLEYDDRYESARTYHNLGIVAEELGEFAEAKTNYLQALEIWAEFNDKYSVTTFSLPSIARIYQATKDESLLAEVASLLGVTVEEVRKAFTGGDAGS